MNDLRTFAVLQARVYAFLEQQDEATLRAIVDGEARLAVVPGDAQTSAASVPSQEPMRSADPSKAAAGELSRLASEQERRTYLDQAKLTVKELKKVANLLGLRRYSSLKQPQLIDRLAEWAPEQTAPLPTAPPEFPPSVDQGRPQATVHENRPAQSNADVAAITAHLCELNTEKEGAAYLRAQHVDREILLAIAAELQLTRVDRLKQTELEKKVLKQAIVARRKFAGLRRW